MEQQLENLRTASTWYRCAAQKIVLYMDDEDNGNSKKEELDMIRALVRENARQEVILKNSCEALDKVRIKLDTLPDLDIDQEYEKTLEEVKRSRSTSEESLKGMEQCVELERDIKQAMEDRKVLLESANCNGDDASSSSSSNVVSNGHA